MIRMLPEVQLQKMLLTEVAVLIHLVRLLPVQHGISKYSHIPIPGLILIIKPMAPYKQLMLQLESHLFLSLMKSMLIQMHLVEMQMGMGLLARKMMNL